ncbi:hypothetical protein [Streptomyces sp. NPDC020983]|uniref:hypothetical protein n=1 Tax=Streptomyces sp. NPDC020983 TaxID=3365106 RepID=UPI0037AB3004
MSTRTLPDHGTLSRAKYHHCHCDKCRKASADYQRTRHRKRGYGTWQPLVDAEPIRQHLAMLREHGISYIRAAELAGLYAPTVGRLLYSVGGRKPTQRVRPETAAALLAVQPGAISTHRVDATGVHRRIQALAANGWPLRSLAPHFGVNPSTPGRLLNQTTLCATTAKAVSDGYERIRNQRPEDNDVLPWDADKARRRAAQHGWRDPLFWEDYDHIDDPDFDPATVDRELNKFELGALRREEIAHLAAYGYTRETIHQRLTAGGHDITENTIQGILREVHSGARRDRRKKTGVAA